MTNLHRTTPKDMTGKQPAAACEVLTWHGCYDDSWRGLITCEAFAHPAKFAPGLIRRIYSHGIAERWWKPGDLVADPFGGIAGGGIMAGYAGLNWIGSELEPRFVELGNKNLALHGPKWLALGNATCVKLVQGDSRQFASIVREAAGVVTSPPYADSVNAASHGIDWTKVDPASTGGRKRGEDCKHGQTLRDQLAYGNAPGQIGALGGGSVDGVITSPPFGDEQPCASQTRMKGKSQEDYHAFTRGDGTKRDKGQRTEGNIAALGATGSIDAVLTSPPYSDGLGHGGGRPLHQPGGPGTVTLQGQKDGYGSTDGQIGELPAGGVDAVVTSPPYNPNDKSDATTADRDPRGERMNGSFRTSAAYGNTPGQIGRNPDVGGVDGVVSPPYENSIRSEGDGIDWDKTCAVHDGRRSPGRAAIADGYGASSGQIGAETKETYWAAMKQVYGECFKAIKPGGVLCCVVKDFVKNKQRVPLCDDTLRLLVHLGFVPVCRIHAMLVKEHKSDGLYGQEHVEKKERKSFFRRLAEKKGSPRIDWEEVLVVRKQA